MDRDQEIEDNLGSELEESLNELRNSKFGKLKVFGVDSLSIFVGIAAGTIAHKTQHPEIVYLLLLPDLLIMPGCPKSLHKRYLYEKVKYFVGATLPYVNDYLS